jgi:hypothetical protein
MQDFVAWLQDSKHHSLRPFIHVNPTRFKGVDTMRTTAIRTIQHATCSGLLCLSLVHAGLATAAGEAAPFVDVFSNSGEWHELSPDRFSTNGEYHEQTGGVVAASAAEPYLDTGNSDLNKTMAPTAAGNQELDGYESDMRIEMSTD